MNSMNEISHTLREMRKIQFPFRSNVFEKYTIFGNNSSNNSFQMIFTIDLKVLNEITFIFASDFNQNCIKTKPNEKNKHKKGFNRDIRRKYKIMRK